jgi:hypothetical protein
MRDDLRVVAQDDKHRGPDVPRPREDDNQYGTFDPPQRPPGGASDPPPSGRKGHHHEGKRRR